MNPNGNQPDPYDVVLADLRAKREQIDRAIEAIEALKGGSPLTPGSAAPPRSNDPVDTTTVRPGMFLGLNIADAVKRLLAMRKTPLGTPEITGALIAGGVVFQTGTPGNTVGSVLHRQTQIGSGIVRVGRGMWGLAEWYPNPGRFSKKKGNDKNGDEGESVEPVEQTAEEALAEELGLKA